MGGSAQNTLLTCQQLSCKYQMSLVHGLSLESNMTESEERAVKAGIESARERGVRIFTVPFLVRRIDPINDIRTVYELFKIIKKEKPDIVHTHTSKAGILGRIAARAAKVSQIIHTPHGHVFYGHFSRAASWVFLWLERILAIVTDRFVALSKGELQDYSALAVYPPDKVVKIHSGVDIEKFQATGVSIIDKKRLLGLEPNGCCIGFVGWLLPIKGPMHLLRAMKYVWQEYSAAHLIFVGKGDLDVDLRAEALNLDQNGRVKFLGWRNDIDEIMQIFDIFILPSLNEGMGRVLVEAMAAGKPIIASNVGGIPELVRHGDNGLLVPAGDEKALADSIKRLIRDPEEANSMGLNGRKRSYQFSLESMVEKIDGLYEDLAAISNPLPANCRSLTTLKADIACRQQPNRGQRPAVGHHADRNS